MPTRASKKESHFILCFLAIVTIGAVLRLPQLSKRPMHTDEAVHGIKFEALLEDNYYRYDPEEYHGPTLNYFTLIPAWLTAASDIAEISEKTLRSVPVEFGLLLILILLLLREGLSPGALLFAGLFVAISPAMVYYSRYYIQEMLLVFFSFAAIVSGYRYSREKRLAWAVALGICLGLMHATKETCILVFAALLLALVFAALLRAQPLKSAFSFNFLHIVAALCAAALVSAIFHSSFFSNPRGIVDSVVTYKTYLFRAGHQDWHVHPWWYYFKLLLAAGAADRSAWSEALMLLLALIGVSAVLFRRGEAEGDRSFLSFLAIYSLLLTFIYCAIPYKTPWSMLGFYHGLLLLAGVGAVTVIRMKSNAAGRILRASLLFAGTAHLLLQSYLLNFQYEADPSNPYVYAHTSSDVLRITEKVAALAAAHPDGRDMYIEVVCPGDDYWPLPWYFRAYGNVGWWNEVDFAIPPAPLIIVAPEVERALLKKLYELPPPGRKHLYVPLCEEYTELRPGIELRGYVRKDLWDRSLRGASESTPQ